MLAKPKLHGMFLTILVISFDRCFFLIFGAGFVGYLMPWTFLIVGVFAAMWACIYLWKKENSRTRILFSLSGTLIVYSIYLSTLFLSPLVIHSGILFIGLPIGMLAIWYVLLYRDAKGYRPHRLIWVLFIGVTGYYYTWSITAFYYVETGM